MGPAPSLNEIAATLKHHMTALQHPAHAVKAPVTVKPGSQTVVMSQKWFAPVSQWYRGVGKESGTLWDLMLCRGCEWGAEQFAELAADLQLRDGAHCVAAREF